MIFHTSLLLTKTNNVELAPSPFILSWLKSTVDLDEPFSNRSSIYWRLFSNLHIYNKMVVMVGLTEGTVSVHSNR